MDLAFEMNSSDIEGLVSDHEAFRAFVYTPAEAAATELRRRASDTSIPVPTYVPSKAAKGLKALYSVCTVTPNYEIRRYVSIADALDLTPLMFEREQDKFVPQNNIWKHALGKIRIMEGRDRNGHAILKKINIVNFNTASGTSLSSIQTLWGQSLIGFHHEMFFQAFPHLNKEDHIFDNSEWFFEVGGTLSTYYSALLDLTIAHGILFENFFLDEREREFTRDIFLPAFIAAYKRWGIKPLIVALEPTDTEGEEFWFSHPPEMEREIKERILVGKDAAEGSLPV